MTSDAVRMWQLNQQVKHACAELFLPETANEGA